MLPVKDELLEWSHHRAVWVVLLVRFLGFSIIFFNPVLGILISIYLDIWDWDYYNKYHFPVEKSYHRIDRLMDFVQYIVMYCFIWNSPVFWVYTGFFLLRFIGMVIFIFFYNNDGIFVFAPNIVEYIGLFYAVNIAFGLAIPALSPWFIGTIIIIKVWQEYELNVSKKIEKKTKGKSIWWERFSRFNRRLFP